MLDIILSRFKYLHQNISFVFLLQNTKGLGVEFRGSGIWFVPKGSLVESEPRTKGRVKSRRYGLHVDTSLPSNVHKTNACVQSPKGHKLIFDATHSDDAWRSQWSVRYLVFGVPDLQLCLLRTAKVNRAASASYGSSGSCPNWVIKDPER